MASTLASLRDRVESFLVDSSNLSWATATLDEAIRLALSDINQAAGATYTLNGLETAVATTLPAAADSFLVVGAAGYACQSRGLDRVEKANLGQTVPADLLNFGRIQLARFGDYLKLVKLGAMHTATVAPHTALDWEEEPPNWD